MSTLTYKLWRKLHHLRVRLNRGCNLEIRQRCPTTSGKTHREGMIAWHRSIKKTSPPFDACKLNQRVAIFNLRNGYCNQFYEVDNFSIYLFVAVVVRILFTVHRQNYVHYLIERVSVVYVCVGRFLEKGIAKMGTPSFPLVEKVWKDNVSHFESPNVIDEWYKKIISRYNGEDRKYHNLRHLEIKLQHFLNVESKLKNKTAFVLALYFQ